MCLIYSLHARKKNMGFRSVVVLGVSLATLSGLCYAKTEKEVDSFKKQPVKTVSELLQDKQTLKSWYETCMDDPGRLGQTPHCINVVAAEDKDSRERAYERYRR